MEATHITSNPRGGKLGTINEDDDDYIYSKIKLKSLYFTIFQYLFMHVTNHLLHCYGKYTMLTLSARRSVATEHRKYITVGNCVFDWLGSFLLENDPHTLKLTGTLPIYKLSLNNLCKP